MATIIGDTLVQVETFTLNVSSTQGGPIGYTRANHDFFITVY